MSKEALDAVRAGIVALGRRRLARANNRPGRNGDVTPHDFYRHLTGVIYRHVLYETIGRPMALSGAVGVTWQQATAVYESLLELRPVVDAKARTFDLLPGRRQRKATGSFYTPDKLVDSLLDTTLEPLLGEAARRADPESALLAVRVCDPACGTGHFLLAAAKRIVRRLANVRRRKVDRETWREVLRRCIHGLDRDPVAVELCRATLWLEARPRQEAFTFLKDQITCGDGLLDPLPKSWNGGFDAVIGNPPYGVKPSSEERDRINRWAVHSRRTGNSAAYFIERCAGLARPSGRIGLVVPKALTYSFDWQPLRDWIRPRVLSIIDVSEAWKDVLLEQVLITYAGDGPLVGVPRSKLLPRRLFSRLRILPAGLTGLDARLLKCVFQAAPHALSEFCATRRGGPLQRLARAKGAVPLLGGKEIVEFQPPRPARFLNNGQVKENERSLAVPPRAVFQNIVAHLRRPSDHIRLIGTVVHEPMMCLDTVNLLTPTTEDLSPQALCGLLMSNLINWFVYVCVYNRAVRTMHFDGYFLEQIPTPPATELRRLHQPALDLEVNPGSQARWDALNEVVCDLYGVPENLREHLQRTHKPRGQALPTTGLESPTAHLLG